MTVKEAQAAYVAAAKRRCELGTKWNEAEAFCRELERSCNNAANDEGLAKRRLLAVVLVESDPAIFPASSLEEFFGAKEKGRS